MSKITFEIEKQEYQLPEVLTIDHYIKVYKMKDFLEEQFFQAKLINTITGADFDTLLKTGHSEITFLSNNLLKLFPDTKYPFYDKFILEGVEYGFIPSWKNMSFAEFIDLDTLLNKKPEEIMGNLHIICAMMFRPIIKKKKEHDFLIEEYDMKTLEERAELFRHKLDVKYVLGGQFFFSQFANQYLNYSRLSLIQKSKNIIKTMVLTWKMRKTIWKLLSVNRSVGSRLSIELVKTILQNTK